MLRIRPTSATLLVCFVATGQANILGDWINNPGYLQGGTPKEQIKCYVLPYGALGFTTHILTSYCVACIARGRSPWHPGSHLQRPKLDIVLGMIGLIVSLFVNMLVVFKCWNSWEFVLIAVWKIFLSLTLSAITLDAAFRTLKRETLGQAAPEAVGEESRSKAHTAIGRFLDSAPNALLPCAKKHRRPTSQASQVTTSSGRGSRGENVSESSAQDYPKTLRWLFLELAGTISGTIGLFALMRRDDFERDKSFWAISLAFGLTATSVFGGALVWSYNRRINRRRRERNDKANKRALEAVYEAGRNGVSRYSRILRALNASPSNQRHARPEPSPGGVTSCPDLLSGPALFHEQRLQEIEAVWITHIKADREIPLVQLEDLPALMIQLFVFAIVISCLLAALYSDWILAYISGSWTGTPSTDNMFVSFLYMGSKLMPLFQS